MPEENPLARQSRLSEEDYEDYEIILTDIQTNIELSKTEQINRFRSNVMMASSGLKGPNGFDLPLSWGAHKHFLRIANRGLENLGQKSQIHRLDKVVAVLKLELPLLLCSGMAPSLEDAHEIFVSAVQKLTNEYEQLTHHLPCSVVAERDPATFSIGPVTFLLREHFFEQNEVAIRRAATYRGNYEVAEMLLARTNAFFSDFQWIASIAVPPCDPEVSRDRARSGVQSALDAFKLLVGSERAANVKQGYDLAIPLKHVELTSLATAEFSLRTGGKLRDAALNDQWYDQVTAGPAWQRLTCLLGQYWDDWGIIGEIETRFLDGLSWYSDALSERDPGAKIIKYWTSIERTLRALPGEIDIRAAVLSSDSSAEFAEKSRRYSDAYLKRRNEVVHGNASRVYEHWYSEAAATSEEASRNVLFQSYSRYLKFEPETSRPSENNFDLG